METTKQEPKLRLLKNADQKFKLIIPKEMEQKIRIACARLPENEWSGVLFYNVKGSFEKGTLKILCRDFLVMDIGSAVYTEWSTNADIISYMCQEDLTDCQMGLIHSHDKMAAYFSGTDLSTLREEGNDRNNVVSLIVNNEGKYVASLTRKIHAEGICKQTCSYPFFGDGDRSFNESFETEDNYVEYFDLEIVKPVLKESHKDFNDRLSLLIAAKNNPAKQTKFGPNVVEVDDLNSEWIPETKYGDYPIGDYGTGKPISTTHIKYSADDEGLKDVTDSKEYKELIERYALKLVSGWIMVEPSENLNADSFAKKNMVKACKKMFGTSTEKGSPFWNWASCYVDYIINDTDEDILDFIDDSDKEAVLAISLHERLEKIPSQNNYIKTLIEIIEDYEY